MNSEIEKSMIFLMALTGNSLTSIGEKLGKTKNDIHEIVIEKLSEYHVTSSVANLEAYNTAWWKSIIKKEIQNIWERL